MLLPACVKGISSLTAIQPTIESARCLQHVLGWVAACGEHMLLRQLEVVRPSPHLQRWMVWPPLQPTWVVAACAPTPSPAPRSTHDMSSMSCLRYTTPLNRIPSVFVKKSRDRLIAE